MKAMIKRTNGHTYLLSAETNPRKVQYINIVLTEGNIPDVWWKAAKERYWKDFAGDDSATIALSALLEGADYTWLTDAATAKRIHTWARKLPGWTTDSEHARHPLLFVSKTHTNPYYAATHLERIQRMDAQLSPFSGITIWDKETGKGVTINHGDAAQLLLGLITSLGKDESKLVDRLLENKDIDRLYRIWYNGTPGSDE